MRSTLASKQVQLKRARLQEVVAVPGGRAGEHGGHLLGGLLPEQAAAAGHAALRHAQHLAPLRLLRLAQLQLLRTMTLSKPRPLCMHVALSRAWQKGAHWHAVCMYWAWGWKDADVV